MASLVAAPAVAAGTLLALSVPIFALKELLEKRTKYNIKKHLGRRTVCRVHFGELDAPIVGKMKNQKGNGNGGNCAVETGSNQSPPPAYNELFRPPPPYGREKSKNTDGNRLE